MRVIELRTINGWGLASGLSATLPLSALAGLVWLAAQPDAPVWAHLWANVLPQQTTTTLLLMLGVAALTGFIGTLSAWIVTFYRIPLRRLIGWGLLLPLAMPTYLMAYSYGDFLDQAGPLYGLWQSVVPQLAYPDFRSLGGAIILLALALYPYVYISARTAFVQQSAVMIEAGRTLGLSPLACFIRIGLPLARPAIIVGVALVLMESMNDIGAVEFLGVNTLTLGVYDTWVVRSNLAGAAQLALTLLAFMALLLALERSQRGDSAHYQREGSPPHPARFSGLAEHGFCDERLLPHPHRIGFCPAGRVAFGAFARYKLARRPHPRHIALGRPGHCRRHHRRHDGLGAGLCRAAWLGPTPHHDPHRRFGICCSGHCFGFGHYDGSGLFSRCQLRIDCVERQRKRPHHRLCGAFFIAFLLHFGGRLHTNCARTGYGGAQPRGRYECHFAAGAFAAFARASGHRQLTGFCRCDERASGDADFAPV
jgi:ABC-type sulfate transport system permease component